MIVTEALRTLTTGTPMGQSGSSEELARTGSAAWSTENPAERRRLVDDPVRVSWRMTTRDVTVA